MTASATGAPARRTFWPVQSEDGHYRPRHRPTDPADVGAEQHPVQTLPVDTLPFLLGSRYCETDRLSDEAWRLFGTTTPGWARVQTICDFVHDHITFGYEHSRATRTAAEAYAEQRGVCRDYAHLALAFCRCLNIRPGTAPGTSVTSGFRRPMPRWISRPGSRCFSGGGARLDRTQQRSCGSVRT